MPLLEESIEKIEKLDLEWVENKLLYMGWLRRDATRACQFYKNFLILHVKYGKQHKLVPSQCIDEVWHVHILNTQGYAKDCDAIFGKILHHDPAIFDRNGKAALSELASDFEKMLELHIDEFGYPLTKVRKPFAESVVRLFRKLFKKYSKGFSLF